jgi:ethanolamine utilization microcompartment shell protein EutS
MSIQNVIQEKGKGNTMIWLQGNPYRNFSWITWMHNHIPNISIMTITHMRAKKYAKQSTVKSAVKNLEIE